MSKPLVIATRGSRLALWQANFVAAQLAQRGLETKLLIIKTTADRIQDRFLHEIGGKGLFVKELEQALLSREADLAVHSLKDMPAKVPMPFALAAVLKRHQPTDVLIMRPDLADALAQCCPENQELTAEHIKKLPPLSVGTGSLRRQAILARYAPQLKPVGIRGNVDTRLSKLNEGAWDAIILAEASIERLAIAGLHLRRLRADWFTPCAAQGALAIECLADSPARPLLEELGCPETTQAVGVEREILSRLGGDCTMPFACLVAPQPEALSNHHQSASKLMVARAAIYNRRGEAATALAYTGRGAAFDEAALLKELTAQLAAAGAAGILEDLGLPVPAAFAQSHGASKT